MSEHDEQCAFIDWARLPAIQKRYDGIHLMHAIPNGGQRHPAVAAKLKREGVLAGIPDIFIPKPCGDWHGMYIEMKYGKNNLSEKQKRVISILQEHGYRVDVCYNALEAISAVQDYYGR